MTTTNGYRIYSTKTGRPRLDKPLFWKVKGFIGGKLDRTIIVEAKTSTDAITQAKKAWGNSAPLNRIGAARTSVHP